MYFFSFSVQALQKFKEAGELGSVQAKVRLEQEKIRNLPASMPIHAQ